MMDFDAEREFHNLSAHMHALEMVFVTIIQKVAETSPDPEAQLQDLIQRIKSNIDQRAHHMGDGKIGGEQWISAMNASAQTFEEYLRVVFPYLKRADTLN